MKAIKLNNNFRIEKDNYSWVLIFNEQRDRKNKETGIKEAFIFEEKWYYPDIKQLLNKFIDLDLKESETLEELKEKLNDINLVINGLSNTIFRK